MNDLHARLLAAHQARDKVALMALYREASQGAANPDVAGFYLTHAYVYALELGHEQAPVLRAGLVAMGRESDEPARAAP